MNVTTLTSGAFNIVALLGSLKTMLFNVKLFTGVSKHLSGSWKLMHNEWSETLIKEGATIFNVLFLTKISFISMTFKLYSIKLECPSKINTVKKC